MRILLCAALVSAVSLSSACACDGYPSAGGDGVTPPWGRAGGGGTGSGGSGVGGAGGGDGGAGGGGAGAPGGGGGEVALVGIEVDPADATIAEGEALALVVTGLRADGGREDRTAGSTGTVYESSPRGVLFDGGDGLFFGDAAGAAIVQVRVGAFVEEVVVTVEPAAVRLAGIEVSPASTRGLPGERVALAVTGRYDDGSTRDLTAAVTGTRYRSADPSVATAGVDGELSLLAPGATSVRVTHARFIADALVTVDAPRLVSFALVPDYEVISLGEEGVLRAIGTYENGVEADLSCSSTYSSSNPAIVEPRGCGALLGVRPGDEVIRATAPGGGAEAMARVSVRDRGEAAGLDVEYPQIVRVGETFVVRAWERYDDGSREEVTTDPGLTFSHDGRNLVGTGPTFTAAVIGQAGIHAQYGHYGMGFSVDVRPAVYDLRVGPGEVVTLEGEQLDFRDVVVEAGGILRGAGRQPLLLRARSVVVSGALDVSGRPGLDGLAVPAPGGGGGPAAAGGGGGADGDTVRPANGGMGEPPGQMAGLAAGAGTAAGRGGGDGGGSGAAGGCAQGGGGGGLRGAGGRGGGDGGPGAGAEGGPAGSRGSNREGGTGGGGGSTCGPASGGGGGGGGGILTIEAGTIEVSGEILADGGNGGAGFPGTAGAGGGSGGVVRLLALAGPVVVTGSVRARGGDGGPATDGHAGGGGGGGAIELSATGGIDVTVGVLDVSGGLAGTSVTGFAGEEGTVGELRL